MFGIRTAHCRFAVQILSSKDSSDAFFLIPLGNHSFARPAGGSVAHLVAAETWLPQADRRHRPEIQGNRQPEQSENGSPGGKLPKGTEVTDTFRLFAKVATQAVPFGTPSERKENS